MHARFGGFVAEDPFEVASDGQPASALRRIAQLQHRKLDWRVDSHIHSELGGDAILAVFEYAVAEAMPRPIRRRAAAGQQRGRPKASVFLVADVIGFGVRIADRVVGPRRETELLRVLAPGIGTAALGDEGPERRVGQDVHPRRRRHLSKRDRDDILTSIRSKAAEPVAKDEIALG